MRAVWLLTTALLAAGAGPAAADPPERFPALTNDEAVKLLSAGEVTLPGWARVLAKPLPRATAAMLDLDYLHRAGNPLGPVLAGKLRWAAADAIGCDYARLTAAGDLKRAGLSAEQIQGLAAEPKDLPEADRAAIVFARKMTRAAHKVTDAEMAALLDRFGPDKVVAMVHTLAHANFQNRIFLALGVEMEKGGPLPPLDLKLDPKQRAQLTAPNRPAWDRIDNANLGEIPLVSPDWGERTFADIGKALDSQKARKPRIPLPDAAKIDALPPQERDQARRIVWSHVSAGYQPQLTGAWFAGLRAYQQEAKPDPLFGNSVFWVITRTNECFY